MNMPVSHTSGTLFNIQLIPHNLPPRSEFIGREEIKARVHEALRSRSYLISIDGIGGIGKTSLALEVAYECLQVSQYVRQLNQTASAPEPLFEQEVLDLPPQLYNRLQSTLLKCGPFDSEVELRAMFVDARISPWRDAFPEMRNRVSRVNVLIDELLHRYATTGENALLLFLQVLNEQASAGDACHNDIATLATELEHTLRGQRKALDTHPEPPALPPSLDVQKIAHFEGFIWATAKDRSLSLNDLLDAVVRTLDYPGIAQKPLEEKHLAVEKLLRMQPCLLIVDNFEAISDDAVRDFLLNLPEPSKALLTTREQKLSRVWAISLRGLTETEALALIRDEGKRLGMQALERTDNHVLLRLYQATGGAPLAVKWAVGQITQRGQSLDTVLTALHEARGDIFDNIFGRSWELLSEDARMVLMVMPLFATSASRAGIEAASDVHHFVLNDALGQLVEMSLVETTDKFSIEERRYSVHPLTRAYMSSRAKSGRWFDFSEEAFSRLVIYYINLVSPPQEQSTGIPYLDGYLNYAKATEFYPEWPNLARIIEEEFAHEHHANALNLFVSVVHFLHSWGMWDERIRLGLKMCESAHCLERTSDEAWLWIDALGYMWRHRGQFSEGLQALNRGRSLALASGNRLVEILADAYEIALCLESGQPQYVSTIGNKLEQLLDKNDPFSVPEDDRVGCIIAGRVAVVAGMVSGFEKDYERQRRWYEQEFKLSSLAGEKTAASIGRLVYVCVQLDDIVSAKYYLNLLPEKAGDKDMAWIYLNRALVAEREGELGNAHEYCEHALELFNRLVYKQGVQECEMLFDRLGSGDKSGE